MRCFYTAAKVTALQKLKIESLEEKENAVKTLEGFNPTLTVAFNALHN